MKVRFFSVAVLEEQLNKKLIAINLNVTKDCPKILSV